MNATKVQFVTSFVKTTIFNENHTYECLDGPVHSVIKLHKRAAKEESKVMIKETNLFDKLYKG